MEKLIELINSNYLPNKNVEGLRKLKYFFEHDNNLVWIDYQNLCKEVNEYYYNSITMPQGDKTKFIIFACVINVKQSRPRFYFFQNTFQFFCFYLKISSIV